MTLRIDQPPETVTILLRLERGQRQRQPFDEQTIRPINSYEVVYMLCSRPFGQRFILCCIILSCCHDIWKSWVEKLHVHSNHPINISIFFFASLFRLELIECGIWHFVTGTWTNLLHSKLLDFEIIIGGTVVDGLSPQPSCVTINTTNKHTNHTHNTKVEVWIATITSQQQTGIIKSRKINSRLSISFSLSLLPTTGAPTTGVVHCTRILYIILWQSTAVSRSILRRHVTNHIQLSAVCPANLSHHNNNKKQRRKIQKEKKTLNNINTSAYKKPKHRRCK